MDIPLIDEPNTIAIEIHISDVLKINDRDFSITFSLYFNVRWIEPRLRLNPTFFQNRYQSINDETIRLYSRIMFGFIIKFVNIFQQSPFCFPDQDTSKSN